MRLKGLIFDLDGTLVDTAPDLAAATNHVLASEGRRAVTLDEIRAMVGQGARRVIERGFAVTGAPLPPERLEPLFRRFVDHYTTTLPMRAGCSPASPDSSPVAVAQVRTGGMHQQAGGHVDKPDRRHGAGRRLSGDRRPRHHRHRQARSRPYLEACWRLGLEADETLMIGDSETDISTARAAGVAIIAVSFGYTDRPIAGFSPDHIVDHFDEVWGLISGRLAARS